MSSPRLAGLLLAVAVVAGIPGGSVGAIERSGATGDELPPANGRLRGIPLAEYRARRAAAMDAMANGIVVLRGRVEEEFGDDLKYRQDNWFMYLTGVETPGAFLILNAAGKPGERETLYIPERDLGEERWTGPQVGPGPDAEKRFGIERVRPAGQFADDLRAIFRATDGRARDCRVYSILPTEPGGQYSREAALRDRVRAILGPDHVPACDFLDAQPFLTALRRVKSSNEVAVLQRAIAITGEAQRDVAHALAPGVVEYEVEAVIAAAFVRNGSMRAGFPSIVGSGIFSTVLHYADNSKRIDPGDLVVVDIGAEYDYYTADITRTWPASGQFTKRQREIYQLVLDTQEAAARGYKPGMSIRDLNEIAREFMRRSPLRDSAGKTLDGAFIHGLSHYLGMDVHDVGDVTAPLKPGDVITIEPGIYLRDEDLGVRIEDDYLVTAAGLEKLSAGIPSSPDAIEQLMTKGRR